MKVTPKDSTDGFFADVVTLGACAIHNATGLLPDECGPDRRGADMQGFGNIGGLNALAGNICGSQLERPDTSYKSTVIAPFDADADDKDSSETEDNNESSQRKNKCAKAVKRAVRKS